MYRRVFAAVVYTHRPVILEFNLHHRLEDTIFDPVRLIAIAHFSIEMIIELACCVWLGCIVEIGLVALLHFAVEGELGD